MVLAAALRNVLYQNSPGCLKHAKTVFSDAIPARSILPRLFCSQCNHALSKATSGPAVSPVWRPARGTTHQTIWKHRKNASTWVITCGCRSDYHAVTDFSVMSGPGTCS
jgi:hypothetical protein